MHVWSPWHLFSDWRGWGKTIFLETFLWTTATACFGHWVNSALRHDPTLFEKKSSGIVTADARDIWCQGIVPRIYISSLKCRFFPLAGVFPVHRLLVSPRKQGAFHFRPNVPTYPSPFQGAVVSCGLERVGCVAFCLFFSFSCCICREVCDAWCTWPVSVL